MSVLDAARQRSAFTDALRPPPGHTLGACIGTTYSLDFEAFTAVILAFVGADVEDPLNDAPSVLTTVARMRSRLRVFVNSGSLHLPGATNRLFALYDRLLRRVDIEGRAFHPKVWVLRFDPIARPEHREVPPVYRVLTASRNVADSRCWELGVRLEGRQSTSKQKYGSDLSAFLRRVASSPSLPRTLWKLLEELKSVEFSPPREAANVLRFDWQWPSEQALINRLPRSATRALVISPFVRAAFLERLCDRVGDLTVVSTQSELDRLSDHTHKALDQAKIFVVTSNDDDDMPSLDLHAKLLAWESAGDSETMIGSANATGPGWGCGQNWNCEAMVSMRPGLGIDAVVKAFVSPGKDELHPWIEQYQRQPVVVDAEEEATKRLERFKRHLCAEQIQGEYSSSKKALTLLTRPAAGTETWPVGLGAEIVPMLQRDQQSWLDYRLMYGTGAKFTGVEIEDVAGFACVVLRDEHHKSVEVSFVVQFELNMDEKDADERDNAVNRRLLEGVDARSLLLNVLSGLPGGTSRSSSTDRQNGGGHANEPLLRRATIERILEVCTADPSRVYEVEAVLAACGDAENMSSFREFWGVFRESLAEEVARV